LLVSIVVSLASGFVTVDELTAVIRSKLRESSSTADASAVVQRLLDRLPDRHAPVPGAAPGPGSERIAVADVRRVAKRGVLELLHADEERAKAAEQQQQNAHDAGTVGSDADVPHADHHDAPSAAPNATAAPVAAAPAATVAPAAAAGATPPASRS
jgi:hypothetical protein